MASCEASIARLRDRIAELDAKMGEKDEHLGNLSPQLASYEARLQELEARLAAAHQETREALSSRQYRLGDKLLWLGSTLKRLALLRKPRELSRRVKSLPEILMKPHPRASITSELLPKLARLAEQYLRGVGVEIGALHNPLPVPKELNIHYVDRLRLDTLKQHYPDVGAITRPDVIGDGLNLSFGAETLDFVIAKQLLEHACNPLGAIKEWFHVLKRGGVLILSVPDRRYCFDYRRERTPLSHLVADYENGVETINDEHYEDWVRFVDSEIPGTRKFRDRVEYLKSIRYSIHVHVFEFPDVMNMIDYLPNIGCEFDLLEYTMPGPAAVEAFFVLRKAPPRGEVVSLRPLNHARGY